MPNAVVNSNILLSGADDYIVKPFSPREVWALITWLFYAAFLHLRLSKGWEGKKSAWLAVIGFVIIMFNLIAVNLIIAGLHSYA